jgi:N-dimethylarginine dimethylaminohydrolase
VELAEPQPGLPDMVFTANAAVVRDGKTLLARFRFPERAGEEPHWRGWLGEYGLELHETPRCQAFEGAGEALFLGDLLVFGWGFRSDEAAACTLREVFGCEVLPLRLADAHYYHLDTCFSPLDARTALYYPGGFDEEGRRLLEQRVERLIALEEDEAAEFGCNAFVAGDTVVTSTDSARLRRELRCAGYDMRHVDLSEFRKAGGAARCLTLQLS